MRKIDKNKHTNLGMAAKTINFEKIVLIRLEERSRKSKVPVSKIVNLLCRRIILSDNEYMKEMMKYHWIKFQEYKYLKENAEITKDPVNIEIEERL